MGPLKGVRVLEFAGIGPGPFCAMMLSDMGAEVLRIDRKLPPGPPPPVDLFNPGRAGITNRGRRSVALDLKKPEAVDAVLRLVERADALFEGFRPGVMERLGLGPATCLARNPRLVYGRMTGWGQEGPLAQTAGHDINYISLSGALHSIGRPDSPPVPPLNLIGDFGGGAAYLAFGIVCGILEARSSGEGQVVDAAMVDGAASLMALEYTSKALGLRRGRGANVLDGGAHYYDAYECADGKYVSVGSIEPHFYAVLLDKCGIRDPDFQHQNDESRWPELKKKLAAVFPTKTREEWCRLLEGTDACFAPVLDLDEAPEDAHNRARGVFVEVDGLLQPAPAPRFSRTVPEIQGPPPLPGEHTDEGLRDWGLTEEELGALRASGAI
ncbi:MAG: CoA transferase [Deltaproteobacteria bacterium]|nr:CoA transferase [Deltaproteobacteria bacterium]